MRRDEVAIMERIKLDVWIFIDYSIKRINFIELTLKSVLTGLERGIFQQQPFGTIPD